MLSLFITCLLSIFCCHSTDTYVIDNNRFEKPVSCAFTNDTYRSHVNSREAYRYFTYDITFNATNPAGDYYYCLVVNTNTAEYGYTTNVLSRGGRSLSSYTQTVNTANDLTTSGTRDFVVILGHPYSILGAYGVIWRCFVPLTNPIINIEMSFPSRTSGLGNGVGFGLGSYADAANDVKFADNPYVLLSDNSSVTNTSNTSLYLGYRPYRFDDIWFASYMANSTDSLTVRFELLGAFDLDYQSGYDTGYQSGQSIGYINGYQTGYSDATTEFDQYDETALTIFNGILEVGLLPINVFLTIFNFEVFGINFAGVVSALLTVSIVIIIFRFLFGGGDK